MLSDRKTGKFNCKVIEGTVESVNMEWYRKRDGSKVVAVWLREDSNPFVDWKRRLKTTPNVGDNVRIFYNDWCPDKLDVGSHHVIEDLEVLNKNDVVFSVVKMLKKALEMLERL